MLQCSFRHFFVLVISLSTAPAQPVKRLYLANDDHTDYMWSGNEVQYDSAFVKMLDYYLDQIDATQSNPPDFQARFNCDGSYWLRVYEKYRSPAQFNRLISRIRSGHISSPLNTLADTYGAQPTEAVIRGMYYPGKLERRFKLQFPLAVCMEDQTLPLGLSSLWAGSGAKYSWRGVCGCATKISAVSLEHRRHQLYRYQGLDSAGVIMKWYNRNTNRVIPLGGYAECKTERKPVDAARDMAVVVAELDALCDTISSRASYPFNVAGAFGYGWDDLDTYVSPAFIAAAQSTTTASRRVRVSNEQDFFEDVARSYPSPPSESVSYGNEWDLYAASINETSANVRRATEKLRSAEALASVASLDDAHFADQLATARDLACESFGLYWEHDLTADGNTISKSERAAWQIKIQQQITSYIDSLFNRSRRALAHQLKKGDNPRFYVFNPLSWSRSDLADLLYDGPYPMKVIDLVSGREVASQLIAKGNRKFLRIHVENVPPIGYTVFEIRNGEPSSLPLAGRVTGEILRTPGYRIRLSPSGAITEIYDSVANGRPLVGPLDHRYVNDLGTDKLNDGQPVVVENAGPVSVTLKAVSRNPIKHTVRLTVFAHNRRIEIEDSIQQNFGNLNSWSFSFNLKGQTTRHEELGAILTAKKESRGGHYASQNARYDWQTFNHFADLSEPGYGITLSNMDCSFFKLGKSSVDSLWEQSPQLNALAGGQVDSLMGISNQNGQSNFYYQFALTTHQSDFNAASAMRFSLEHQNPLVTGMLTGGRSAKSSISFSLLTINNPDVLLWSVKPSEEGMENGLITRFWNMKNEPVQPVIRLYRPIKGAWKTTHIETNKILLNPVKGALPVDFNGNQINTFRILIEDLKK